MRKIDSIIIHCSATKAGREVSAGDIDRWHRERGFDCIGYHYVICLRREYPSIALVLGHRDTSPDKNGNGVVEPFEYVKACPCFDVGEFLRTGRSLLFVFVAIFVFPLLFSACKSSKSFERQRSEVDSVSMVARKASSETVFQSVTANEEEHIEQTVFVLGGDTPVCASGQMRIHPYVKVVRTVVKRKSNREAEIAEEQQAVAIDSVQRVHKQVLKEKNVLKTGKDIRWKLIGAGLLVLVIGGVMYKNRIVL